MPAAVPAEIAETAVVIVVTGIAMKKAVLAKWKMAPAALAAVHYNCSTGCLTWGLHSHSHSSKENTAAGGWAHLPAVDSNSCYSLYFLYSPHTNGEIDRAYRLYFALLTLNAPVYLRMS